MIGTAASAAGSAASFAAQQSAANKNAKFQSDKYNQTVSSAQDNYTNQIRLTGVRDDQENAAASDQSLQNQIEGTKAVGAITTVTGERGIGGNSVEALKQNFQQMTARNEQALTTNRKWRQKQMAEQLKEIRAGNQNRINAAEPSPVNTPSPFALALGLLGTAAQGAANYTELDMKYGGGGGSTTNSQLFQPGEPQYGDYN